MNWFKYRLPHSDNIVAGASERLLKGLSDGFAFAPFESPESGIHTIPLDFVPDGHSLRPEPSALPRSTSKEEHASEVEAIIRSLGGGSGKTVAARAIRIERMIDISTTFRALCDAYPDAFVFAFSTSDYGTWFGASPELLLETDGTRLRTVALAGTRPAGSEGEWDQKNVEEQNMVTEFIKDILSRFCNEVTTEKTYTRRAAVVEHICTPISAVLKDYGMDNSNKLIEYAATSLSPTPAVCGSDRDASLELIRRHESFERELYGGFCGPVDTGGRCALFVMLRSAKCTPSGVCLYAGGGITRLSSPDEEWKETEIKSKTILNKLIFSEE